MPFSRLHNALQSFMPRILAHPFNKALFDGTLSSSVFNHFLIQDQHYLKHYAYALTNIAHRLHKKHATQFHHIATSIKKTELNMHRHYLHIHQPNYFFKPVTSPIINAYIQHLHETTQTKPIPVAIAALLPCCVIYRELGVNMPRDPEHRFYNWIKTYSSSSFVENTEKMIRVFNAHCEANQSDEALGSFTASVQYEINFWDSVYKVGGLRGEKHAANPPDAFKYGQ